MIVNRLTYTYCRNPMKKTIIFQIKIKLKISSKSLNLLE